MNPRACRHAATPVRAEEVRPRPDTRFAPLGGPPLSLFPPLPVPAAACAPRLAPRADPTSMALTDVPERDAVPMPAGRAEGLPDRSGTRDGRGPLPCTHAPHNSECTDQRSARPPLP